MSLKEYFEMRKKQKEIKAKHDRLQKMLKADKAKAQEILNNFSFVVQRTPRNGDINGAFRRIIDEHNMEYCFIPEIWGLFPMAHKMAIMIKFSQKHNKYHLTLDDFCLPTEKYKQEENIMHIEELVGVDKLVIDYDETKMSKALPVLVELLSYEDKMKEKIFKRNMQNYKTILDFKSIEELKYLIDGNEKKFGLYFKETLLSNPKAMGAAVYQYVNNIENRATLQAIDIMENVSYYASEAKNLVSFYQAYCNYWTRDKAYNIKNVFG
ncbi:MAG: hypothetical protein IKR12_01255, partial [Clostridia bacterium]|nr:hypothetical protein [Clostridia bacterium]